MNIAEFRRIIEEQYGEHGYKVGTRREDIDRLTLYGGAFSFSLDNGEGALKVLANIRVDASGNMAPGEVENVWKAMGKPKDFEPRLRQLMNEERPLSKKEFVEGLKSNDMIVKEKPAGEGQTEISAFTQEGDPVGRGVYAAVAAPDWQAARPVVEDLVDAVTTKAALEMRSSPSALEKSTGRVDPQRLGREREGLRAAALRSGTRWVPARRALKERITSKAGQVRIGEDRTTLPYKYFKRALKIFTKRPSVESRPTEADKGGRGLVSMIIGENDKAFSREKVRYIIWLEAGTKKNRVTAEIRVLGSEDEGAVDFEAIRGTINVIKEAARYDKFGMNGPSTPEEETALATEEQRREKTFKDALFDVNEEMVARARYERWERGLGQDEVDDDDEEENDDNEGE